MGEPVCIKIESHSFFEDIHQVPIWYEYCVLIKTLFTLDETKLLQ